MQDMKLTPEQQKAAAPGVAEGPNKEEYPYGLRIHLDKATLEKLGIQGLPKVGAEISLDAVAVVRSISASESKDGGDYKSCELQITQLGIEEPESSPADKLYGVK